MTRTILTSIVLVAALITWFGADSSSRALAEAGTLLFLNPRTGGKWTQASIGREWARMEKRLELDHIKANEALRHAFGTRTVERLIGEGRSREDAQAAVMRIMGHTSRATSDRYVKLAAETMRADAGCESS